MTDLSATAPPWLRQAMARPSETQEARVDGLTLEVRSWGRLGAPGLLFVHGNAAHIGWWSFIAPLFADDFRVTTFALAGMGQSGWREAYSSASFAREMWAAADAGGLTAGETPPIIVAHSMGGLPLIHAAAAMDRPIRAAVLVDVSLPGPEMLPVPPYSSHRLYDSLEQALSRFRLSPPQPFDHPWLADYLGRLALKEVVAPDGTAKWTWRFDPKLWEQIAFGDIWGELARVRCPLAIIKGELSQITSGLMEERMRATAPAGSPYVVIPEAHHHVMIDQPLALVAALRTLIAAWVDRG